MPAIKRKKSNQPTGSPPDWLSDWAHQGWQQPEAVGTGGTTVDTAGVQVYVGQFTPEAYPKPVGTRPQIHPQAPELAKTSSGVVAVTPYQRRKRAQFTELASRWRKTRGVSSRVKDLTKNEAYESVIAMGWDVVPFIFEDLDRVPDHWFLALQRITGADPVKQESRGVLRMMADDWINWAVERGHYRR